MTLPLEYHKRVNCLARRSVPASLALFGTFLFFLFALSGSSAQFNGGSGASSSPHTGSVSPPTANFVAPRTGSVAPPTGAFVHNGSSFVPGMPVSTASGSHFPGTSHFPGGPHSGDSGRHHPHHSANGTAYYPYVYALPVPYGIDVADADSAQDEDDDADYQGGPTIFDRRGLGAESYVPPSPSAMQSDSTPSRSVNDSEPEATQSPTTLVFRDGHQVEVGNYAIVSTTLYDLTPGHPRKIALADIDLSATQKQNEDHGIVFQLPPSVQAN